LKKIGIATFILVILCGTGISFAASPVPNLVGTWATDTEGIVMFRGGDPGAGSMHGGEGATLDKEGRIKHVSRQGKVMVTAQKGRILHGTFTSEKATENFVMVIGWDNKTVHAADHDGFFDGNIVNKNKINFIYRHVSPEDTVALTITWTRNK
jgi:hypothetical protein